MTVFAHALSASVISLMIARVDPSQSKYVFVALAVPSILDLDHVFLILAKRKMFKKEGVMGNLHKARSFFHEMLGALIFGIISLILWFFDRQLSTVIFFSFLIHVIEDMTMGRSVPFWPVSNRECRMFNLTFMQKTWADVAVIIISLFIWANYLIG